MRTDPITLEVLIQRFRSIAEEMGYALQRTATPSSSTRRPISGSRS